MDTLRVLIVDDEPGMRLAIRKALQKMSIAIPDVEGSVCFEVDMAESGEEAIEKITHARPDILLLDYKLPKMSGLDVLDAVTMNDDEMVTLMLTAYASIDIAITAIKRGAFDFIAKPFTPDELKKTIAKASFLRARFANWPRKNARFVLNSSKSWDTNSNPRSTPSRAICSRWSSTCSVMIWPLMIRESTAVSPGSMGCESSSPICWI